MYKTSSQLYKSELDKAFSSTSEPRLAKDLSTFKSFIKEKNSKGSSEKTKKLNQQDTKEATSTGSSGAFITKMNVEQSQKIETKEATTGTGQYQAPDMWAQSMQPKDWRGKNKTQIPGGSFVQIKDKCKKFPYCNQGDINALNLTEYEGFDGAVKNVSKKLNVSESIIRRIIKLHTAKIKKV